MSDFIAKALLLAAQVLGYLYVVKPAVQRHLVYPMMHIARMLNMLNNVYRRW